MRYGGGEHRRFECQACFQTFAYDASIREEPKLCSECEKEIGQEDFRRIEARNRERAVSNTGRQLTPITDLIESVVDDLWRLYQQKVAPELERIFRPDGYIYLLGGGGYYKIGRSKNVNQRVRQLKIQLPWPVKILHTIPCEDHIVSERCLHQLFEGKRANGEWFSLTSDDVEEFRSITRMRGREIERGA